MKEDKSFTWTPVEAESLRLQGMKVAVIGGTGGIGRAFSRLFAARGAEVIVVGRSFRDAGTPGLQFVEADLSSMAEAQRVAKALPAEGLDLLIFTTGIFASLKRQETAEGIERDLAVSYLNRFVMLRELAPRLGSNRQNPKGKPRVFFVAYPGSDQIGTPDDLNAEKSYKAMAQHMNTVAGNEILILDAAQRYPGVGFYEFNPGLIATDIRSNFLGHNKLLFGALEWMIGLFSKDVDTYARQMVPLMIAPELEGRTGDMFNDKAQAILPSAGLTPQHRDRFLRASEALVVQAGVTA
jgi:NAD(P)-dependent dehydrogenase (short-subunit alcohol dehydrogenase family)